MTAANPAFATAYDNLSASLNRAHAEGDSLISEAIDAVVSAHQHGGKDAFDERVDFLRGVARGVTSGMVSSMDAMRQVAGHIGSLPVKVDAVAEPVVGTVAAPALAADNQPAQDSGLPVSQAARTRGTRTSDAAAEG